MSIPAGLLDLVSKFWLGSHPLEKKVGDFPILGWKKPLKKQITTPLKHLKYCVHLQDSMSPSSLACPPFVLIISSPLAQDFLWPYHMMK